MNRKNTLSTSMAALFFFALAVLGFYPNTATQAAEDPSDPSRYNVTFGSPSKGAEDSMPLGNGELALNAWFEKKEGSPNPDLMLLFQRTDSWGDNSRHLKIGRLRISVVPVQKTGATANAALKDFNQTLHLEDSTIRASWGEGKDRVSLQLWIDANRPVVQLSVESAVPSKVLVKNEVWRDRQRELKRENMAWSDVMYSCSTEPYAPTMPTILEPDTILTDLPGGMIGWCHHNIKSVGPREHAKTQGVADFERPDPLLHRTFGAIVAANNAERVNDKELLLPENRKHDLSVYVRAEYPSTIAKWKANTLAEMEKDRQALQGNPAVFRSAHEAWWRDFWRRSWIHTPAGDISRAYTLWRYVIACAGRGNYPIKFNGSLFCVGGPDDPDYRNCGSGYWWQNTRLPYYTMCPSGDFEMMKPLFKMYVTDLFEFWRYRTRRHTWHEGIYIPECIHFWGDNFNTDYGWTPFEERGKDKLHENSLPPFVPDVGRPAFQKRGDDKLQEEPGHKYEWVSTLELVCLALDLYDYTQDRKVLDEIAVPLAEEAFKFFSQHYKQDDNGKLVMWPAQACESWRDCTNPMPEVAGLHAITQRLLALEKDLATPEQRDRWKTMQQMLPPIPLREVDGVKMLAPGEKFAIQDNRESPELYAIFPFRQITAANDTHGWGKAAFDARGFKQVVDNWSQHSINAAYLRLTDEAASMLQRRIRSRAGGRRFPVWYHTSVNEVPDGDNGGAANITLQSMLMQVDGNKIYLLPAWPKNWDVNFRLHAPGKTVIDCRYQDGKIQQLDVTPESRRKDIVIVPQKEVP